MYIWGKMESASNKNKEFDLIGIIEFAIHTKSLSELGYFEQKIYKSPPAFSSEKWNDLNQELLMFFNNKVDDFYFTMSENSVIIYATPQLVPDKSVLISKFAEVLENL